MSKPSGTHPWDLTEPILIVSATVAEAAHVPPGLPLLIVGIGKVPAAIAVAEALATYRADGHDLSQLTLINIGSAGALHDHHEGIHEIGVVVNHDINADVIRSLGHDPEERIELGEGSVLASGDVFVTDPIIRNRLAEWADLVDMEGYAIAAAARHFGVRCRLVKHVSDKADEASMDWPTLVEVSAVALGEYLNRL